MKLIRPDKKYIQSYIEANEEDEIFRPYAERRFRNYETIIESSYNMEHGINLPINYVRSTTFWLIDNKKFIGEINIRHELNSFLLNYGGHIGYEIRQSECMKGYGTKMLSMALTIKVIENNGGILENKVKNILPRGNVTTRRYWINI